MTIRKIISTPNPTSFHQRQRNTRLTFFRALNFIGSENSSSQTHEKLELKKLMSSSEFKQLMSFKVWIQNDRKTVSKEKLMSIFVNFAQGFETH